MFLNEWVRILLAQRQGIVDINPEDHEDDFNFNANPTKFSPGESWRR